MKTDKVMASEAYPEHSGSAQRLGAALGVEIGGRRVERRGRGSDTQSREAYPEHSGSAQHSACKSGGSGAWNVGRVEEAKRNLRLKTARRSTRRANWGGRRVERR
jgi:hypothetical protein